MYILSPVSTHPLTDFSLPFWSLIFSVDCTSVQAMSISKTIYFIRHGQSEHNVFEEAHCHEPDYRDPNLFDAE